MTCSSSDLGICTDTLKLILVEQFWNISFAAPCELWPAKKRLSTMVDDSDPRRWSWHIGSLIWCSNISCVWPESTFIEHRNLIAYCRVLSVLFNIWWHFELRLWLVTVGFWALGENWLDVGFTVVSLGVCCEMKARRLFLHLLSKISQLLWILLMLVFEKSPVFHFLKRFSFAFSDYFSCMRWYFLDEILMLFDGYGVWVFVWLRTGVEVFFEIGRLLVHSCFFLRSWPCADFLNFHLTQVTWVVIVFSHVDFVNNLLLVVQWSGRLADALFNTLEKILRNRRFLSVFLTVRKHARVWIKILGWQFFWRS